MSFKGGVKEAAKMLMGLSGDARKKLLETIKLKDPRMAEELSSNLISIEDIQFLTPTMLVGLLRDIDLEVFGLALRGVDSSITNKVLEQVSTGMKLDIEDGLKAGLKPMTEVQKAQDKVLEVLRSKIELGQIVINPEGDQFV